jgi:glucose-6-phosphate isomerase
MDIYFFDNTDPDGFDRVFARIAGVLSETLVIVISKSGGTKETYNGMKEAEAEFAAAGLEFRAMRGRDRTRKRSGSLRRKKWLDYAVSDARLGRRPDIGDERGRLAADGTARLCY